jgi:hypothetical protein
MHVIGRLLLLLSCLLVPMIAGSEQPGQLRTTTSHERPSINEVRAGFANPPHGYGEVAFYWWLGDTLTRERLAWQLDQLNGKGVVGLQVNYAHSDSGGLIWGLTMPSQPKLFSEEWWDLFGWFMKEAKKRGMAVSLSDYTLGIGQGACVDEALAEHPELMGSEVRFEKRIVSGPGPVAWQLPAEPLSVVAYRVGKDTVPVAGTRIDVSQYVRTRELQWTPGDGAWMILCVWAERILPSFDPMNPRSGEAYIERFYGRFDRRFPGEAGKGINYFFSDELSFRLQYPIWDDAFAQEFLKRKGYDVRPYLPALFVDTGPETPTIRLDYNDVMVALSEEHFFRPLYQWHQDHGMTFGCDHGGRGKDVAEFGDYFRTQRWNQGPGCDQPRLEQDIIKNKVASSIAHLYRRPRVWLEGFHSSGWGTTSAEIADAVFGNFVMGQNLLTFHGLYYSTHGGWWEWAPPCNHFRMPYWQHIDPLMKTVQRLSYTLTQGTHRCDVAILYPVEPVIAGTDGQNSVAAAFAAGEALYNAGIDFDFIDYESLVGSTIKGGKVLVSGEEYRLLIIPSMKTIRFASLAKCRDLVASGGTVVNVGSRPETSEKGRGNKEFEALCSALFGDSGFAQSAFAALRTNLRGGALYQCNEKDSLSHLVSGRFPRDFAVLSYPPDARRSFPRVMHRRIGTSDVYAVYNLPQGTECFFRSKGKVELWNPWTGERRPLFVVHPSKDGTVLPLPLSQPEVQLIVFTPGSNDVIVESATLSVIDSVRMEKGGLVLWGESRRGGSGEAKVTVKGKQHILVGQMPSSQATKSLSGEWEFEVQPVLDNRWGDFHWPPTPSLIGTEIRRLAYNAVHPSTSRDPIPAPPSIPSRGSAADTVSCSFGARFWKLGPLPGIITNDTLLQKRVIDPSVNIQSNGKTYSWHAYPFSWRWGVEDDPGHQGYHGLKEVVHDEFIRLGLMTRGWTATERHAEEGGTVYCLYTGVVAPSEGMYTIEPGPVRPSAIRINGVPVDTVLRIVHLSAGVNTLLLWYDRPCVTYFVLRKPGEKVTPPRAPSWEQSAKPLASSWYGDANILPFDTRFAEPAPEGWYYFTSAPGMRRMQFAAHGTIEVFVGGERVAAKKGANRDDGATEYIVELGKAVAKPAEVAMHIQQKKGYYGGAAIPDPVRLDCERGVFEAGDWSRNDGLYSYSGGARYRRSVPFSSDEVRQKVELDLGSVASSAEVWINGQHAGLRVSPPWAYDISKFVHEGDNAIEVLVYNTAANHYTSIPTRYRGSVVSGILGPVTVKFTGRVILKGQ